MYLLNLGVKGLIQCASDVGSRHHTHPHVLVKNLDDDCGRVDSDLVHVSPEYDVLEHQHSIPRGAASFPDHVRVAREVREDHAGEGV